MANIRGIGEVLLQLARSKYDGNNKKWLTNVDRRQITLLVWFMSWGQFEVITLEIDYLSIVKFCQFLIDEIPQLTLT